jgi:hypothetical protein
MKLNLTAAILESIVGSDTNPFGTGETPRNVPIAFNGEYKYSLPTAIVQVGKGHQRRLVVLTDLEAFSEWCRARNNTVGNDEGLDEALLWSIIDEGETDAEEMTTYTFDAACYQAINLRTKFLTIGKLIDICREHGLMHSAINFSEINAAWISVAEDLAAIVIGSSQPAPDEVALRDFANDPAIPPSTEIYLQNRQEQARKALECQRNDAPIGSLGRTFHVGFNAAGQLGEEAGQPSSTYSTEIKVSDTGYPSQDWEWQTEVGTGFNVFSVINETPNDEGNVLCFDEDPEEHF